MRRGWQLAVALGLAGCGQCGASHHASPAADGGATQVLDEARMAGMIDDARVRAGTVGKRVLLVYVGDATDPDTRLMLRFLHEEPAASSLARGYEPVYVNVGTDLSRHPRLRHADDVRALVSLVVVDPSSNRRSARRLFAPATGRGTVTSRTLAAWLDDPRGR